MSSERPPARQVARPARSVLSDETYQAIRTMLLEHTIAPGQHINIDAVARMLVVSQTPVREALARLESDDLVVKQPLRGYTATELLTRTEVDDLFQFRLLIEPWSAGRAAGRLTADDRAELAAEVERGGAAGALESIDEAYAAMSEHDARFHELIAQLSGSKFVKDAFIRTHCHLHLFRLYQASKAALEQESAFVDTLFGLYYSPTSGFLAYHEHEGIAEAILGGDPRLAHDRMRDHIQSSRDRFSPAIG